MDEIRVASIGDAGHFNIKHGFGQIPGLTYVAAASDGYGRPKPLAPLPDSAVYGDYGAMLDEVNPNVVTLGCWYAHNGQVAIECLGRGIHVITDKPAVNSREELGTALALCRTDPSLVFITEFGTRMAPAFRAAHDAVRQGRIGQPVLLRAQKSYRFGQRADFFRKREHFAGLIAWVASHAIDYLSWASGLGYISFQGLQGNLAHPDYGEMEDHAALLCQMEGGAAAVITADYLRAEAAPTHGDDRLRIAGTDGVVEVMDHSCVLATHDQAPGIIGQGEGSGLELAREYVATLRGQGSGVYSTGETLRIARAILAARDAADCGEKVSV